MGSHIFIDMAFIYYLEENNVPFYIGKCKNKTRRRHSHYRKFGTNIKLIELDQVGDDKKEWKFWESYYISLFRSWGFNLVNQNEGGGGPSFYSEESKQKMRKPRPGSGEKISKTLKERNHSKYYTEEVIDKIRKKLKGKLKPFTKEHIQNLAKANLESKGKMVECLNLDKDFIKDFNCLREAKEWLLIIKPNISKNVDKQIKDCCLGRQKTAHGYIWKYKS